MKQEKKEEKEPLINLHDLIAWSRWIDAGETQFERDARSSKLQRYLFPIDLAKDEKDRRESLLAYVQALPQPSSWKGWPDPRPVPDEHAVLLPPAPALAPTTKEDINTVLTRSNFVQAKKSTWEGLIPASSPAYRRASKHDGTGATLDQMRKQSTGSPFFDDNEKKKERSEVSSSLGEPAKNKKEKDDTRDFFESLEKSKRKE